MVRDVSDGFRLIPKRDSAIRSTAAGRCARRCAAAREVLELWASERALGAEPWLREAAPRCTSNPSAS